MPDQNPTAQANPQESKTPGGFSIYLRENLWWPFVVVMALSLEQAVTECIPIFREALGTKEGEGLEFRAFFDAASWAVLFLLVWARFSLGNKRLIDLDIVSAIKTGLDLDRREVVWTFLVLLTDAAFLLFLACAISDLRYFALGYMWLAGFDSIRIGFRYKRALRSIRDSNPRDPDQAGNRAVSVWFFSNIGFIFLAIVTLWALDDVKFLDINKYYAICLLVVSFSLVDLWVLRKFYFPTTREELDGVWNRPVVQGEDGEPTSA